MKYTSDYSAEIERLKNEIQTADAIVIGAGAGLSTAAGFTYSGERFDNYFSDFAERFGITDMYSGGFYPFPDDETFWAWWQCHQLKKIKQIISCISPSVCFVADVAARQQHRPKRQRIRCRKVRLVPCDGGSIYKTP